MSDYTKVPRYDREKVKPCVCGGEMLPMLLSVDERTNRSGLFCVKCGHEEKVKPKQTTDQRLATLEWNVEQLLRAVLELQEASYCVHPTTLHT